MSKVAGRTPVVARRALITAIGAGLLLAAPAMAQQTAWPADQPGIQHLHFRTAPIDVNCADSNWISSLSMRSIRARCAADSAVASGVQVPPIAARPVG